ncbi:hypothetical protein XENTR_v10016711 [Xenopus tropicalis]|nr:hypothetical protein XENTR_v10016711 [Xenopus tropicalis]
MRLCYLRLLEGLPLCHLSKACNSVGDIQILHFQSKQTANLLNVRLQKGTSPSQKTQHFLWDIQTAFFSSTLVYPGARILTQTIRVRKKAPLPNKMLATWSYIPALSQTLSARF